MTLVGLSWVQHAAWRDSISLWSRMTQVYPESDWGFDRLGRAFFREGDLETAAGAFMAASERAPTRSRHLTNAAAAFMGLGRTDLARSLLMRATALDPGDAAARQNLARLGPTDPATPRASEHSRPR